MADSHNQYQVQENPYQARSACTDWNTRLRCRYGGISEEEDIRMNARKDRIQQVVRDAKGTMTYEAKS